MMTARQYILVPVDAGTVAVGAREVKNRFVAELGKQGLGTDVQVLETGSFGPSNAGVVAAVQPDGVVYGNLTVDDVPVIVQEHLVKGRICGRYILPREHPPALSAVLAEKHAPSQAGRIVLDNCGVIDPTSIEEYISTDGFMGLGKALTDMTPRDVLDQISVSGLRGRGGAGFPTGRKWALTAQVEADEKYVICNADEGEPGTFKDRLIMEGDPFKVIEGMAICGYAIGASQGFIYIRGEYALSIERMEHAIAIARENGLLGKALFESDFDFDLEVRIGAGAYVCGEETALIESMEGKRGIPRLKPPYPAQCGFRSKPTNVNNVETLANVPAIIRNGGEWFRNIGTTGTPGTKVYSILGHINRPGLIEVSTGVTLREVINEYGGGMKEGEFKMAQLGGTAGDLLGDSMLDVPMDFDSMQSNGHVLGSGAILIMNQSVAVCDFLDSCMKFFKHESCGNCNPCRNGVSILKDITSRLKDGKGYPGDIQLMEELVMDLKTAAFCPLGQSPAGPVMSAIRYFREELEAGIDKTASRPRTTHIRLDLVDLAI